jgi:hypothetical protein
LKLFNPELKSETGRVLSLSVNVGSPLDPDDVVLEIEVSPEGFADVESEPHAAVLQVAGWRIPTEEDLSQEASFPGTVVEVKVVGAEEATVAIDAANDAALAAIFAEIKQLPDDDEDYGEDDSDEPTEGKSPEEIVAAEKRAARAKAAREARAAKKAAEAEKPAEPAAPVE